MCTHKYLETGMFQTQSDTFILRGAAAEQGCCWWGLSALLKGTHPSSQSAIPPRSPTAKEPRSPWTSSPASRPSIPPSILATAPKSNWTAHVRGLNGKQHTHTHTHTHTHPLFLSVLPRCLSLFHPLLCISLLPVTLTEPAVRICCTVLD